MRKIFKPKNVINDQSAVMIPDIEFPKDPEPMRDENGEPEYLTEEVYEKIRKEIFEETKAEVNKQKMAAVHERDSIIAKAKKDAKKLMDDAAVSRKSIINDANVSAAQLKKEAYEEGLKQGIIEKSEILEKLAAQISEGVEQMKRDESEYFTEYEKQIKYIAMEIAEKIIYQKIQEDDTVMYNLVKNAIRSVRSASWITAEISGKLSEQVAALEQELSDVGIKAEIIVNEELPDDACVLDTSDGFVVATVSQQLAILKNFIDSQDKGGNDD